jgi:conjugative relaxase-like TrwC/TraI family protein
MQTTHKIPGESATTYTQYLTSTASRGDYYTRDGGEDRDRPVPSRWHGSERTLNALGLSAEGPVARSDLRAVMKGRSPLDGEPLRPAGSDGSRVAGVELMLAPPKTVSALWAAADPYRRAQLETAHRQAVASTLARTEREVALLRRKTDGVVRFEKPKQLLAAEFVHTSSRLAADQDAGGIPDPQLHSHLVVFAAERKDGKLAAVESKQLYKSARENGAWYRAELAENLRSLGLRIERRTGKNERYFEVSGVPEDLASRWSSRSEDVDRAARLFRQRYGREPQAGELGSLTMSTRGSKTSARQIDVNAAWRALGEEHGLAKHQIQELFDDRPVADRAGVDLRKELLSEVTRERSMITEHELKAKAYELSAGVCRPAEMDRLVNEMVRSGELIQLQDRTWTTLRLREMERSTIEIAQRRAGENAALLSEQSLKRARREIGREIHGSLTHEQQQALRTITGPGGIAVLVGRAGTGKGVTISAAARAWQLQGKEVIGTAIAGATAKRLGADAKLDRSMTTDSLLSQVEKGNIRLDSKTVVVMDEAGMADSDRFSRLVRLTAERESKLLVAGDAAQISSIAAGGLFKEIEGRVPTAELTEVHRAQHEWERNAWEQIRNGEPGPALAQYQAHDRLHIHDTRAQAARAMVEHWNETRKGLPDGQAVMITDASNKERDQINAMAQERRAQAGELGAHRVELPEKPYGLAAGDQIILTAQCRVPGQQRVENGITATILHADRDKDRVRIKTNEREEREVDIDTSEFSDISLAYAVHIHKGQGLTAETSGILTGGWQTDKEHTYVAVSRAREQTQIYISRDDLGEQGMDPGAIERLAQRMQRSRAQTATITMKTAEREPADPPQREDSHQTPPSRRRPGHTVAEDDGIVREPPEHDKERVENHTPGPVPQTDQANARGPIDIREAAPESVQVHVVGLGETRLAYSNAYSLQSHTGEPTYALFGGWQTEKTLGYIAAVQSQGHTETYISTEDRGDRDIETELTDRIGQTIERSQSQQANHTDPANTEPDHEPRQDHPALLEPGEHDTPEGQTKDTSRAPHIEQAIQEAQERQQAWEHGISPDQDNDRRFGIE